MPNLDWFGKKEILTADLDEKIHLLERDDNLSCGESDNLIIHGDNMPVMKSLLKDYRSCVKCIYIDPPYNTGAAFETYDDNFEHSQWLSFMYPRLRLLKEFLTEDGAIFISIDDNEQAYLKVICDEIFGRDNFVNTFIWNCATAGGIRPKFASKTHEYIFCYAKQKLALNKFYAPLSEAAKKMYRQKDNRGVYREKDFVFKNPSTNENQKYFITCPDGEKVIPKNGYIYRFIKSKFEEALENDIVVFKKTTNGPLQNEQGKQAHWNIYIKKYLGDATGAPASLISKEFASIYNVGTQCLQKIFDGKRLFENAKPIDLIEYLLKILTDKDSIILDAFAGSGTTAHAVINLNQQDGGNRKFILIESADYCSTVTAERVKRVGGSFNYLNLGVNLYTVTKEINPVITYDQLAKRIWRRLTKTFLKSPIDPPLIGIFNNTAIYLLLDTLSFRNLSKFNFDGEKIIFAESCLIGSDELKEQKIIFKHLPRNL